MKLRWYHQVIISAALLGVFFATGWFLDEYVNQYHVRVVINCGIAFILALSLNLVNGFAGQFSLGHAGFMAVGAYVSAALTTVLPDSFFASSVLGVQIAVVLGGIAAGIAGYLVGLPSLRLRGDYLAIVTLGFGEIIRIVFLNVETLGGPRGMPGIPRSADFFWVYVWAAVTFAVLYRIIYSSTGRAILSVREDEIAAEAMGINIAHYKVVAFVISSFFAGIAGGLFAHYQGFIDPSAFNFTRSVDVVIMVVIGGMGSLSGSLLGAIVVTVFPEVLRVFEQYRLIIFPLILIALMLLRPMGIMGHLEFWDLGRFMGRKRSPKLNQAEGPLAK